MATRRAALIWYSAAAALAGAQRAVVTQSTATASANPSAVGSRPRLRLVADPKTTGKPAAEGTISMGESRYGEAIFKLDIISSSRALSL
jgi:hypothetical protein